jgi:hypothetical protein
MVATSVHVTPTTVLDALLDIICGKLQLTTTQYKQAEERYLTIGRWLSADESIITRYHPIIYPQGSLRINTTVKPILHDEYDLDLVLELRAAACDDFPQPVNVLDLVEYRVQQHGLYCRMYERKNRCIRITYENDFHLDILPACADETRGGTCLLVPDRKANAWKPSNPIGYADWFERQASRLTVEMAERHIDPLPRQEDFERKAPLKLATQLFKRDRDVRYRRTPEQAPISIVLTTLAGLHYGAQRSVSHATADILSGIVGALPTGDRLRVYNPSNPAEDLSERWDEDRNAYALFVDGIRQLHRTWHGLMESRGIDSISRILEGLFGETTTKQALVEFAERNNKRRLAGELGVTRAGIITNTKIGTIPIKANTFYGD